MAVLLPFLLQKSKYSSEFSQKDLFSHNYLESIFIDLFLIYLFYGSLFFGYSNFTSKSYFFTTYFLPFPCSSDLYFWNALVLLAVLVSPSSGYWPGDMMMVFFWISFGAFFYFSILFILSSGLPIISAILSWKYLILILSFYFFLQSLLPGFLRQSIIMLLVISRRNSRTSSSLQR